MGELSSDSDSGSGSESSANTNSQLESLTGPEFLRRNRPACHLRKTHGWLRKFKLIRNRLLLVSERLIYPRKETKKQMNQLWMNLNEQPVHKNILRFPRYFLYAQIYSSLYSNENSNIIKLILNELGARNNYTYVLKLLFAAAEIICRLDQGKAIFFSKLNFIVNTLKIIQIDQHLHSNNFMIIYIDGRRQFGHLL